MRRYANGKHCSLRILMLAFDIVAVSCNSQALLRKAQFYKTELEHMHHMQHAHVTAAVSLMSLKCNTPPTISNSLDRCLF